MPKTKKSHRNKTIDFSLKEGQKYFNRYVDGSSELSEANCQNDFS